MLDIDGVPYFPFKLISHGDEWQFVDPVAGHELDVNSSAYWLLGMCDGYRTWGEIVTELGQAYRVRPSEVVASAEPILLGLVQQGALWWRRRRMLFRPTPAPLAVLWNLTDRCNLACRHCVVGAGARTTPELPLETCHRLVAEFAQFGVQQLILSGGEPLMRRGFFDIAEHAAQLGLGLQIATNATLLDRGIAQRLARLGANAQVSLDGATPAVHDRFRGVPGAWAKAVAGARELKAAGVPFITAAAVTKHNLAEVPDLYALAAELGAQAFRILPFVPMGRGGTARTLEVTPDEMHGVVADLVRARENGGLPVVSMEFECTFRPPPGPADPEAAIGCGGATAYCTLTADGEVLPCNFFAGAQAENVNERDFAWIWQNSRFLNYFRSLTVSDIKGACQRCAWLADCRGSCIAASFSHGDIFQANCHCWVANPRPAPDSKRSA
jgi:radical SAM protein with 4Fe4S-binding SPASM domain